MGKDKKRVFPETCAAHLPGIMDLYDHQSGSSLYSGSTNVGQKNPYVQLLEGLVGTDPYTLGSSASIELEDRTILYQTPDEPEYLWYRETVLSDIAVSRSYGGAMQIQVNNTVKNDNYNDVTILVYNSLLDDVVCFNSDGVLIR